MIQGKYRKHTLSHLRSNNAESANIGQDFHGKVAVGHATINLQVLELSPRVTVHAFDDSAGLEGICLKGSPSDVGGVGVL